MTERQSPDCFIIDTNLLVKLLHAEHEFAEHHHHAPLTPLGLLSQVERITGKTVLIPEAVIEELTSIVEYESGAPKHKDTFAHWLTTMDADMIRSDVHLIDYKQPGRIKWVMSNLLRGKPGCIPKSAYNALIVPDDEVGLSESELPSGRLAASWDPQIDDHELVLHGSKRVLRGDMEILHLSYMLDRNGLSNHVAIVSEEGKRIHTAMRESFSDDKFHILNTDDFIACMMNGLKTQGIISDETYTDMCDAFAKTGVKINSETTFDYPTPEIEEPAWYNGDISPTATGETSPPNIHPPKPKIAKPSSMPPELYNQLMGSTAMTAVNSSLER
jgi:hypothetical protein